MLLVSWAALQAGVFPKALYYLGILIGLAGLISVVPIFGEVRGLIYEFGQIVWFVWLGVIMLHSRSGMAVGKPDTLMSAHAIT